MVNWEKMEGILKGEPRKMVGRPEGEVKETRGRTERDPRETYIRLLSDPQVNLPIAATYLRQKVSPRF